MVSLAKHWVCIQSYSTGFLIRSWLYINSKEILAEICRVHINKIFWCKYPKKYQSDEWSIFWKLVCPFRPMCAAGKHSFIGLHLWDTQRPKKPHVVAFEVDYDCIRQKFGKKMQSMHLDTFSKGYMLLSTYHDWNFS